MLCFVILSSCAPHRPTSSYSREQMGRTATVMQGVIVAMREVRISGTSSGLGAATGAAGGGVAGSYIGGDARANVLGAIGGAVIGGIVGAAVERAATEAGAIEFIIKQDNGQLFAVVQTNEETLAVGENVLILRSDRVRVIRDRTKENSSPKGTSE
jgi:outer membrane lipoprotein SlyB